MAGQSKRILAAVAFASAAALAPGAWAGPVILGGDDLNDHGSFNGTNNIEGWLYIQNALANLLTGITRPGNDGTIVVLGAAPTVPATSTPTAGESCGAAYWPAQRLVPVRTVTCIDTAAGITTFFANLAAGTANPAIIVYPGNGASNGVDTAEETALLANAGAISNFVASGGGLLGHTGPYTWLSALVPGITTTGGCIESGATLTPAGVAAFPTVTNADITAGPCHNSFAGNLGGLGILALDGSTPRLNFIIGGGAGTSFAPVSRDIPTMSEWTMILMALLLASLGAAALRRR